MSVARTEQWVSLFPEAEIKFLFINYSDGGDGEETALGH